MIDAMHERLLRSHKVPSQIVTLFATTMQWSEEQSYPLPASKAYALLHCWSTLFFFCDIPWGNYDKNQGLSFLEPIVRSNPQKALDYVRDAMTSRHRDANAYAALISIALNVSCSLNTAEVQPVMEALATKWSNRMKKRSDLVQALAQKRHHTDWPHLQMVHDRFEHAPIIQNVIMQWAGVYMAQTVVSSVEQHLDMGKVFQGATSWHALALKTKPAIKCFKAWCNNESSSQSSAWYWLKEQAQEAGRMNFDEELCNRALAQAFTHLMPIDSNAIDEFMVCEPVESAWLLSEVAQYQVAIKKQLDSYACATDPLRVELLAALSFLPESFIGGYIKRINDDLRSSMLANNDWIDPLFDNIHDKKGLFFIQPFLLMDFNRAGTKDTKKLLWLFIEQPTFLSNATWNIWRHEESTFLDNALLLWLMQCASTPSVTDGNLAWIDRLHFWYPQNFEQCENLKRLWISDSSFSILHVLEVLTEIQGIDFNNCQASMSLIDFTDVVIPDEQLGLGSETYQRGMPQLFEQFECLMHSLRTPEIFPDIALPNNFQHEQ